MKEKTRNALLVGAGFLGGTLGIKALTSSVAKKGYVHVVAGGMKAKAAYLDIVEQAKAEVDDIVAEATYISGAKPEGQKPAEGACCEACCEATA